MENGKIKILLIEDSIDDTALIRRKLEKSASARFKVAVAKTLQDGLEQLAKNTPDLILSDLGLPDSHGLDTVTKILLEVPHIPLVVLSGFDDEAVAIKAVQSGAQDYLVKGQLENSQLERTLYYSIERARLQAELEQHTQEIINVQANLHKILEKNADAIVVVGKDKRILFINPAGESLLGRKQKELLHQPFDHKLITGKTSEIVITRPDKEKYIAEMSVVDIDWEGNPANLVSMHDITERKQMENALKESEEKFSAAFRSSPNMIAIANMNNQKFVEINDSYARATGYTREEIIGHLVNEINMFENSEDSDKMIQIMLEQGKVTNEEYAFRIKSGEIRQWLCSAEMINIGGDPCIITVATDITERKRMENAVKESEEKFSKAFHSSANLFAICRLDKGNFIEVNESFIRMTGYTREELIGHNATELNFWASEADHDRIINKTREHKSVRNEQIKTRSKSGEIHTGLFSSEQITIGGEPCFINTITDITELKRAEESVRVSEEKFSKAFLRSPEVIIISNIDDGTVFEANDTFLRLTGYTRKEVIGKKTAELGIWAIPEERAAVIKKLKEKGIVSNEECRFRIKSGEIRVWLFSAEIITIDNKPCMLSVTTDITERKKAEEELRFSDIALKSIHEGVFAMDNEFKITRWNEMCEQMLGVKASDAIGKSAADVITMAEAHPGQNIERVNLLIEKGFNKEEQVYRTPRGDIWVNVQAQAMEDKGKRYGWITLISDITERKKTEEALRFSDAAFKSIHESVIATDTNRIVTHWNKMSEKIFGVKTSEAIGKNLESSIDIVETSPGDNERRNKIMEAGGNYRGEVLHRTRYGDVWVDVTSQAIEENGKRYGWVNLATDITQRKLAEEALRQSEEKFRELINTSNDGIVSIDPQMRFILWNQGAERLLGYTEKEMLGQSVLAIFPESDQKNVAREIVKLKNTGTSTTINTVFETYIMQKDCSLTPVDISISARKTENGYISTAIMRDITERKEAEERIRKQNTFLNNILESVTLPFYVVDANDYTIIMANSATHAGDLSKKPTCYSVTHRGTKPCDGVDDVCPLNIIKKTKKPMVVEHVHYDENGNPRNVEVFGYPIFDVNGNVIQMIESTLDITERKQMQEKLRKIDQMKSEFLSNVSHELRTPLQSISGFTKLIMNGQVPDPATQQEFFQIIDRETMHLGNLINGLLDMSRLEAGRFQIYKKLVSVRDTFNDPIRMFRSQAREKNINLTENLSPEIPEMEIDSERVRQVVINLVGNAIKFSDPGSSVTVQVGVQPGELLFQVSDHGIGISEQNVKHLFERFYRAEGETVRGGTGLGLYISKQIIEAHGGRIWAESKFGEGSTFSFTLPLNAKGGNGNGKENPGH